MTDSGIQRPSTRPTPEHEEFIRVILDTVEERLLAQLPTMGTVSGTPEASGGTVKVHVDGEDEPRSLGFARSAGVTYQDGDRVLLVPNRAGEYVIAGIIATGNKPVVGKNDVQPGAIGKDQMGANSVGSDQIIGGSFRTNMLPQRPDGKPDTEGTNGFSLDGEYIKSGTIDGGSLVDNSIAGSKIAGLPNKIVKTDQIDDSAVTNAKIATNSIVGGDNQNNSQIKQGTIQDWNIKSGTITDTQIKSAAGSYKGIGANKIDVAGLAGNSDFLNVLKDKLGL